MCWVAVERAVRIARQRGLPGDLVRWMASRDAIYEQIMQRGWHAGRRAFVQHYETDVLDASLLLMPLVKFVAPTDPRWPSTLDAISRDLVSDSLVYRYDPVASPDGLIGEEGTFSLCSFWFVEALARAGRVDEARLAFEKMLTYANHVGLYAEEIGPSGESLGNFPQAFTHLALISAACSLHRALALRAAVTDIDRYALADLLNRRSPQTVGAFLRLLGIDPAEVPAYAGHVRTSLADPVVRNSLIDYLAAEPALRARILAESGRLRDAILRLLQREAPGDGPVTFVDLGWGATIQGQLTRALAEAGAARETVGLYLMTGEHAARQVANGGAEVHGFLGDFGIPRSAVDLVARSPELLEQVCMPAHGSQLDRDNNLDPVLEAPATPSLQRLEAEAVRSGILSFQNEWARHRSALPGKLRGLDSAQQVLGAVLVRSIVDPTAEEVAAFGHWHHDASDDVTELEAIADTALLPRLRYMEPDQVRRLPMNEVYWPFGLAAQVDEHWPSLLRAAAAGQIPWEAMASRLETGTFVIEASQGIDVDDQPVEVTPTRNRFGLTAVTATLTGAQIFELTLRRRSRRVYCASTGSISTASRRVTRSRFTRASDRMPRCPRCVGRIASRSLRTSW